MTRLRRPVWAEVNLDHVAHNVAQLKGILSPGTRLMAVVKADGYGHGAVEVARTALACGAAWLGVAIPEEAFELLDAGIRAPILVLGVAPEEYARELVERGVRQCVADLSGAEALSRAARELGRPARVHLKIDTGMGRIGPRAGHEALELAGEVARLPNIELEGIFSHFAVAELPDKRYTCEQLRRFLDVVDGLQGRGINVPLRHIANSAATMELPRTHLDMVRIGIAIYGLYPGGRLAGGVELRPAMSWKARVSFVKRVPPGTGISYGLTHVCDRETTIATLPLGYADGYSRALSNRAKVILRGHRLPVVGRVCMDQVMVDAGDLPVCPGDTALLMGRDGELEVSADELADLSGTINYEVVCLVGKRVPRVYLPSRSPGEPK